MMMDAKENQELELLLQRVDSHVEGGDFLLAREELALVPTCHEFHPEVLRRRMRHAVYEDENFQDLSAAARWGRALIKAEPYDAWNWIFLDWVVERLEGKSAAVEILREGVRRHGPDFTLYYNLASHLCALDRLDEAREEMLLALKQDPFALKNALESDCFTPIHDFIREQASSEWFREEMVLLGIPNPLEKVTPSS